MNAAVLIAVFHLRHLAAIMSIERASFGSEAYGATLFRRLHSRSAGLFYVAVASRRVRGYIVGSLVGKAGEIVSLAVHPDWRRTGIGRALFAHMLAALAARGATHVELAVRIGNAPAVRFYRQFGLRKVGTVEDYYEEGGDAWIMRAVLK